MLGKRTRSLHRTASSSHFGRTCGPTPQVETGFNPINTCFHQYSPPSSPRSGPQCWVTEPKTCVGLGIGIGDHEHTNYNQEAADQPPKTGHAREYPSNASPLTNNNNNNKANDSAASGRKRKDEKHIASKSVALLDKNLGNVPRLQYLATYAHTGGCQLPAVHFLEACFKCKKRLGPGRDIYMYRGDRAFCSVECRWQHIAIDERREKCGSAALKPTTSASPAPRSGHPSRIADHSGTATVA